MPVKIVLSVLLVFPLAFLMGLLFPQGIRLVERAAPELVPWAWGANSAASILGSIFSLIFAISSAAGVNTSLTAAMSSARWGTGTRAHSRCASAARRSRPDRAR